MTSKDKTEELLNYKDDIIKGTREQIQNLLEKNEEQFNEIIDLKNQLMESESRRESAQHNYETTREWAAIDAHRANLWEGIAINLIKLMDQPKKEGILTL